MFDSCALANLTRTTLQFRNKALLSLTVLNDTKQPCWRDGVSSASGTKAAGSSRSERKCSILQI